MNMYTTDNDQTAIAAYPESWYAATANDHPEHPELQENLSCDVCVIGAGFTGLSTALHLVEKGYDVVLLEAKRVAWGASGRNGGQLTTGFNREMSLIEEWLDTADAHRLWDMGEEAKQIIASRVFKHDIQCDLKWGSITAAIHKGHLSDLQHDKDECFKYGYEKIKVLDQDELQSYIKSPRYIGGLFDSGSGQLHPLNYAIGLAKAFTDAGGQIFENSEVTDIQIGYTPIVKTARAQVKSSYLVIAGNAYIGDTGYQQTKIMPCASHIVVTEPLGDQAEVLFPKDVAVCDAKHLIDYYRLTPDKRLLFGAGATYAADEYPGTKADIIKNMLKVFPSLKDVKIDYFWGGRIATTLNQMPQFCRIRDNVYTVHGYAGHGIALSNLAGKLMAEAITGTAERFDIFAKLPSPDFPGGTLFRKPLFLLGKLYYQLTE